MQNYKSNVFDDIEDDDYTNNINKYDEELEIKYNRKELSLQDRTMTIEDLERIFNGKSKADDLVLDIDIQRNNVWNDPQKNKLIDSIFFGIPINFIWTIKKKVSFYTVSDKNLISDDDIKKQIVIDGKQRLSAIKDFLDNKLILDEKYMKAFQDNKTLIHKKKFSALDKKLQTIFYQSKINFKTIEISSDESKEIIWEMFTRINQNSPLSKQEIFNATYPSEFNSRLKEHLKNEQFRFVFKDEKKIHLRFKSLEIIYRFLGGILKSYNINKNEYNDFESVPLRITGFMKFMNNKNKPLEDKNIEKKYFNIIDETMEKIRIVFGNNAFKKWTNESNDRNFFYKKFLNVPLAEMQLFTMYLYKKEFVKQNKANIEQAYKNLFEKDEKNFLSDLRAATGDPAKMKKRIKMFSEYIHNECKKN